MIDLSVKVRDLRVGDYLPTTKRTIIEIDPPRSVGSIHLYSTPEGATEEFRGRWFKSSRDAQSPPMPVSRVSRSSVWLEHGASTREAGAHRASADRRRSA